MRLQLPAPNWPDVLGAPEEAAWIADRDRKFRSAAQLAVLIQDTYHALELRKSLFQATPETIRDVRFAAVWYVSLIGYSQKTLKNIAERPRSFGLTVRPETVVRGLTVHQAGTKFSAPLSKHVPDFCRWLNAEIAEKYPPNLRNNERALITVAEILGGRIIGQGQNQGGNEAVVLVKELLVKNLEPAFGLEVGAEGKWEKFTTAHNLLSCNFLRFGKRLVCDFTSGGNRPDISMHINDEVLAVGEIKGRKDLSNVWESWMPQVATHMNSWTEKYPKAARLFLGTLIVEQMVEGFSRTGTRQVGFRGLHKDGKLTAVYNVGNVVAAHPGATGAFKQLISEVSRILK